MCPHSDGLKKNANRFYFFGKAFDSWYLLWMEFLRFCRKDQHNGVRFFPQRFLLAVRRANAPKVAMIVVETITMTARLM